MKDSIGETILYGFVEKTSEYQATTDVDKQQELKKKSFAQWMTFLYLVNSDQHKYGSLLKHFCTQYLVGNNQYCEDLMKAADVLTNHTWDESYKENIKKNKLVKSKNEKRAKEKRVKNLVMTQRAMDHH